MGATSSAPRDPSWPANRFPVDDVEVNAKVLPSHPIDFPALGSAFYSDRSGPRVTPTIEVTSDFSIQGSPNMIVHSGSLVEAALLSFSQHYPLCIRPDDIWSLLSYGFAKHVEFNAEELRSRFVQHSGTLELLVDVPPNFVVGQMTAEDWTREVFPQFSQQIRSHIGPTTHDIMVRLPQPLQ